MAVAGLKGSEGSDLFSSHLPRSGHSGVIYNEQTDAEVNEA